MYYLDNLKVILIAAIIALHTVLGIRRLHGGVFVHEVRKVTLNPVVEASLLVLIIPFGLF